MTRPKTQPQKPKQAARADWPKPSSLYLPLEDGSVTLFHVRDGERTTITFDPRDVGLLLNVVKALLAKVPLPQPWQKEQQ